MSVYVIYADTPQQYQEELVKWYEFRVERERATHANMLASVDKGKRNYTKQDIANQWGRVVMQENILEFVRDLRIEPRANAPAFIREKQGE